MQFCNDDECLMRIYWRSNQSYERITNTRFCTQKITFECRARILLNFCRGN